MPATTPDTPEAAQSLMADRNSQLVRAFASREVLGLQELLQAPVRWPRPSRLARPLPAAGRKMAAGLEALGLSTVGDLLEHLPTDSRHARTVAAIGAGEQATVAVQVRAIAARPVRRRGMRPLVEATVFDATGTMRATFFNQPWLVERYPPGTRLLLHGKADGRGGFRVAHHAVGLGAEEPPAGAPEGGAVAHYPASEGVSSTQILTLVQGARDALHDVPEALSGATRASERLPDRACALAAMHFPGAAGDREGARRRLAFEELLMAQLVFLRRRAGRRSLTGALPLDGPPALTDRWLGIAARRSPCAPGDPPLRQGTPRAQGDLTEAGGLHGGLPFTPTGDQLRAIATLAADLAQPRPMQRLLMGEVGSGKTVVALYAMLRAVEHGHQAALMAPTETLAEQHFATIQRLLGSESVSVALLTGSTPAGRRRDILGKLATGELSLVVGTHALIEPDVRFAALAVGVIDEQHRFGVRQRAALGEQTGAHPPHVLHMTATPIPRTLALARFGDLDTSILRELPRGRQPIRTRVVAGEAARASAYEELRAELAAGRQAYVVCPLVEEAELPDGVAPGEQPAAGGGSGPGLKAAKAELLRLREGELRGHELALLHGGMRPRAKQEAMAAFAAGRAEVLVATTVIEVGIDVANATVMLIENAERFGISQLHQLRGRVGRGEHPGRCFLAGPPSVAGSPRLRALAAHTDGFRLAELDLELRKEGELVGTRQSGIGSFRVASLPQDAQLLELARARAEAIVASDPDLAAPEHVLLGWALRDLLGAGASEPIPA